MPLNQRQQPFLSSYVTMFIPGRYLSRESFWDKHRYCPFSFLGYCLWDTCLLEGRRKRRRWRFCNAYQLSMDFVFAQKQRHSIHSTQEGSSRPTFSSEGILRDTIVLCKTPAAPEFPHISRPISTD